MSRKWQVFLLVTLAVLVLDQATKWWIFTNLGAHDEIQVIPGFFSLVPSPRFLSATYDNPR